MRIVVRSYPCSRNSRSAVSTMSCLVRSPRRRPCLNLFNSTSRPYAAVEHVQPQAPLVGDGAAAGRPDLERVVSRRVRRRGRG